MKEPAVELRHVSKAFHSNGRSLQAILDISLAAEPGEIVTIIGPSGSGKSTLFNLITGLLQPDSGEVLIGGQFVPKRTGLVGYMPQRDLLLPWRSVLDNVILPLEIARVPRNEAYHRAHELLPLFGLESFEKEYPAALSGGMRQRAALLRTVLAGHDILLLDEPFGALDALTRRDLQDWMLQELWRKFKQTILFITHDIEEALYLGDRVIVLSGRPGSVARIHYVNLPRPRRRGMIALPIFGQQMKSLLEALEIPV
jgi:ABC-type nitrate/sulfonate/bicarbonate transport system ATPase subunit